MPGAITERLKGQRGFLECRMSKGFFVPIFLVVLTSLYVFDGHAALCPSYKKLFSVSLRHGLFARRLGNCSCIALLAYIRVGIHLQERPTIAALTENYIEITTLILLGIVFS